MSDRHLEIMRQRRQERDPLDVRAATAQLWIVARICEGHQLYLATAQEGYWSARVYQALAYPSQDVASHVARRVNGVVMMVSLFAEPVVDAPMAIARAEPATTNLETP